MRNFAGGLLVFLGMANVFLGTLNWNWFTPVNYVVGVWVLYLGWNILLNPEKTNQRRY